MHLAIYLIRESCLHAMERVNIAGNSSRKKRCEREAFCRPNRYVSTRARNSKKGGSCVCTSIYFAKGKRKTGSFHMNQDERIKFHVILCQYFNCAFALKSIGNWNFPHRQVANCAPECASFCGTSPKSFRGGFLHARGP